MSAFAQFLFDQVRDLVYASMAFGGVAALILFLIAVFRSEEETSP